jgi:hypothetical protein
MQSPLAYKKERPCWEEVETALENAFEFGGGARLDVLRPDNLYIKALDMRSLSRKFRIVALTRDENPKNELLEWWESGATKFRGNIRFNDDDWDARTVSSDLDVAREFFYELYKHGELNHETLKKLRSQWNPMPQ